MKLENPFITKGYVSPDYFCDREEETATLLEAIKNNRDVVIYGKRKIGKTALIQHVFYKLGKKAITIWVDLLPSENFEDLLTLTANAVLAAYSEDDNVGKKLWSGIKKLRPTMTYDEFSGTPNVSFDITNEQIKIDTFSELLQLLSQSSKKVVLAFDEFQQIGNYPQKNIEEYLRTLLQTLTNVTVLFSGSDQHMLLSMFNNLDRPFYNFGQYLKLGHIDSEKYVDFIQKHFKDNKKSIDKADLYDLIEWCNNKTMNIQMVANRLFSGKKRRIDREYIEKKKQLILKEKEDIYYTMRRILSKGQWKVIEAFAEEGKVYEPYGKKFMNKFRFTNSSTIRRVVTFCLDKGLLYQSNDGSESYFELDDIFLRRWIELIKV